MRDTVTGIDEEINEEYKIWKKNVPFLYSMVLTHAHEWPSLTVQFLPQKTAYPDQNITKQKIILGTHTSSGEQNYLMLAELRMPSEDATIDATQYDQQRQQMGGFGTANNYAKIEVVQRINHDGEVNRARYCPQKPNLIATKTVHGPVYVFDYTQHDSTPSPDGRCTPLVKLRGHKKEGYGLSWSTKREGRLASAGDDHLACVWDIDTNPAPATSPSAASPEIDPIIVLDDHGAIVEDVAWHHHHEQILATVCDDKYLRLWDARTQDTSSKHKPTQRVAAHTAEANCVDFSPFSEYLLVTGGSDKVVKLWDLRNMKQELHAMENHTADVFSVQWAPFNETIIGSCGSDRRVMVWDIARIGTEQTPEDAEDGPPELLFIHGGHTSKISDFSWCPTPGEEWVVASVAEDNILQVWQMAENIYNEDLEGSIPAQDLE